MATQAEEINRLLRGVIGQVRQDLSRRPVTNQPAIAPYVQTPVSTPELPDTQRPSLASRIIDVLSRPLYAVTNVAERAVEDPSHDVRDVLSEAWEGLSGRDKVLGSDVLEAAGMERGLGRSALGFGVDVLADPITYIPGINLLKAVGAGGRATQKSLGALRGVQEATETASSDLIARAVNLDLQQVAQAQETATGFFRSPRPVAEPRREMTRQVTPVVTEFPQVRIPNLPEMRRTSAVASLERPNIGIPQGLQGLPVEEALPRLLRSQQQAVRRQVTPTEPQQIPTQAVDSVAEAGARESAEIMAGRLSTKPMPPAELSARRAERVRELTDRFMKKNKHSTINEAGQEDLLRIMINDINRTLADRGIKKVMSPTYEPMRYASAFEMVREAENILQAAGRKFEVAGKPLRMSEVMNEVGPRNLIKNDKWRDVLNAFATGNIKNITHEPLRTELGKILGNRAAIQTDVVDKSLSEAVRRGSELNQNAVAAQAKQNKETLQDALGDLQKRAGIASQDSKATKSFLREILDEPNELPLSAVQSHATALMRQAITGKADPASINAINKAVYDYLGGKPKILARVIGNNRAGEAIMTRLATWWGARDLRPFQREALDTARISAAAFTQAWAPIVRSTTAESRQAAWRAAQGALEPANAVEARVAQQFTDAMEKLLHSPNLSNTAAKGNTVALRAGINMDELNQALKETGSKLEFTNSAKITDKYGVTHDFSKDADWLKSWTAWDDVDDPVEALYRVHLALQRTTRKNAFLDDIAARWGYVNRTGDFNTKINHPRLEGFWFPREISEQANTLLKSTFDPSNYRSNSPMIRLYDRVLGAFKSGVTIYNPSHHIRNAIGDIWLSSLDGVITPAPYMASARVLHSQRGRYKDMMGVMDITDPEALSRAMTRPGDTIITTKGGQQLTAEQIYTGAFNSGILMKATQLEDIIEGGGRLIKDLPVTQGRVRQAAHGASELRDHYVRLAHFIHALKKSKTKNLDDLFHEAAHRVKRYHPDGMDMTEFERTVMRRLIPFYSWQRKSIPLIVEAMVQRPGLVTVYPKGMQELQDLMGVEPVAGMGDPFPADQMFPEWIRAKGIGPLLTPENPLAQLARNEPPGYVMINPSVPFNDAMADFADPIRMLRSSLTPVASVPMSLYGGEDPLGIPIEHSKVGPISGAPAYLAQQALPPLATGARLTGSTRPEESFSPEQLIRWLTASGLIGTGPYKQQAVFEERERRQG